MPLLPTLDLGSLPASEDDKLEYKSSATAMHALRDKIGKAASGFWNSGGGIFVVGVDGAGKPDGGIAKTVGRQAVRDWIDQAIQPVAPGAEFAVKVFEHDPAAALNIAAGNCVVAIEFISNALAPHMAPDNKYYIRAGAHTVPAGHFVVEALLAKRHFRTPRLISLATLSAFSSKSDFLNVEIVAATEGVAIDVEVDLSPPPVDRLKLPLLAPLVDRDHPFKFRFEVNHKPTFISTLKIAYRDLVGRPYAEERLIDADECLNAWHQGAGGLDSVSEEIRGLKRAVERLQSSIVR
jgi:hypothetical protein